MLPLQNDSNTDLYRNTSSDSVEEIKNLNY